MRLFVSLLCRASIFFLFGHGRHDWPHIISPEPLAIEASRNVASQAKRYREAPAVIGTLGNYLDMTGLS